MAKKKTTEKENKRLVILDSHAIIHRAYHAIPDFSSSKGEPTGALYGLVSMLLKIVHDLKPDYIVAARDLPGKTHRHEAFEAYKATRAKADGELVAQLKRAPVVFKAFGIPLYEHAGYEADDVVGTIVKKVAARDDLQVIVASGDMDTLQLVEDERVQVFTLRKGLNDTVIYDEEAVNRRYGFGPEHIADYKALRGDPSDNIPGIRGIGEKTAIELIKEFGSIEKMYAALKKNSASFAKKVKPHIFELIKDGEKEALFSKQLGTIHIDVPLQFTVPEKQWNLAEHAEDIFALCDELEFRSLKERVRAATSGGASTEERGGASAAADSKNADPRAVKETALALWLLHSDTTNPTIDDILNHAHTERFDTAREMIFKQLKETGKLQRVFDDIEKPLIPVIERMSEVGIFLDIAYMKKLAREYTKGLAEIAGRIYRHAGREFNINSPKQLATVLYDELKIVNANGRQRKTAGGARTTREDELDKLHSLHPIIGDVLAYRELQKLLSTYIEKLPTMADAEGRLHAEFLQAGTTTGRMSSQNPNLQNIPIKSEYGRRIRNGFIASPGYLLVAIDYSQIELRIAAGLSGDEKLGRIFREGGDVHTAVASDVFGVPPEHVDREMRRRAKVINFGILYGMGVNALRANLGENVPREEAARYLSAYFKNYSGLARYIEHTKADAARRGYTETLFGRRRYFPSLTSALPNLRAQAERMAVNAPIQGLEADIIKRAMVEADALIEKNGWRDPSTGSGQAKVRLLLQVHDELVYEIKKEKLGDIAQNIKHVMESVVEPKKLSGIPIVAEVSAGPSWGDLKRM